jgi:hypothetical protein
LPSARCGQELLARNITGVERKPQLVAPYRIELSIGQHPAPTLGIPVFANPMILEFGCVEVRTKTAARPCWHSLGPEHADQRQRERIAPTGDAVFGRTGRAQWTIIKGYNSIQPLLHGANVNLALAHQAQIATIEVLCDHIIDSESGSNGRQGTYIVRHLLEPCTVAARIAHGAVVRVVVRGRLDNMTFPFRYVASPVVSQR